MIPNSNEDKLSGKMVHIQTLIISVTLVLASLQTNLSLTGNLTDHE